MKANAVFDLFDHPEVCEESYRLTTGEKCENLDWINKKCIFFRVALYSTTKGKSIKCDQCKQAYSEAKK